MAGPAQPLDLSGSLAVLQALLNAAAGVPGATAQYELGPWVFPQVGGDGVAVLPNGDIGTTSNGLSITLTSCRPTMNT
jgi:hypothetical protein